MKAVVAAFNQEKALVGAFSVIVQLCRLIVYSTKLNFTWRISLAAHCSYLRTWSAAASSGHRSFSRKVIPPRYFTCEHTLHHTPSLGSEAHACAMSASEDGARESPSSSTRVRGIFIVMRLPSVSVQVTKLRSPSDIKVVVSVSQLPSN